MKIIAITQARIGSTRLPSKVIKEINGKSLLEIHLSRILDSKLINDVVVATTFEDGSEKILEIGKKVGANIFQGSTDDVLDRFYKAAQEYNPDYVVRLTSDCPLIDPQLIDAAISLILEKKVDYVSNTISGTFPDGQDVEVFTFKALEDAWINAKLQSEREHVTPFIWKNSPLKEKEYFTAHDFTSQYPEYGELRITVDEQEDFDLVKKLINNLGDDKSWLTYAEYLKDHDEVRNMNTSFKRNEGYQKSLNKDIKR